MQSEHNSSKNGVLFMFVGPGGVGKNTLMNALMRVRTDVKQLPTATTRDMRPDEIDGVHHYFVSKERFNEMIANDELVEYEEVHPGKFYGVVRKPLDIAFANDRRLVADIEISGAKKVSSAYPDNTVIIFIDPPSYQVLEQRMRDRGTDEAGIQKRLDRYEAEMAFREKADYVVINDDFDTALDEILGIIKEKKAEQETVEV